MNKKVLFVLLLSWFIVGCATGPEEGASGPSGPSNPINTMACETKAPQTCEDKGMNPIVKINLDNKKVDPECLKVNKGRPIIFKLESNSAITKDTIVILPENAANDFWLARSNWRTAKQIKVLVPKKGRGGKGNFPAQKYKYEIHTPNWCIDPRVDVRD